MDEQVLAGGVSNAGSVVRSGPHVLRPSNPHSASVHAFLRSVRANGFDGAPMPVGIDDDGRERLVFMEGDVPLPPYPAWARTDTALGSIAALLARFHGAAVFDDAAVLVERRAGRSGGRPDRVPQRCLPRERGLPGRVRGRPPRLRLLRARAAHLRPGPAGPHVRAHRRRRECGTARVGACGPARRGSGWRATATGSTGPAGPRPSTSSTTRWPAVGSSSSAMSTPGTPASP